MDRKLEIRDRIAELDKEGARMKGGIMKNLGGKKATAAAADEIERLLAEMAKKGIVSVRLEGLGYFLCGTRTRVMVDRERKKNSEGFQTRLAAARGRSADSRKQRGTLEGR